MTSTNFGDGEGKSCPCKRLPLCLSSFTAAELGNVASLTRRRQRGQPTLSAAVDGAGNTPLHYAAQHGHIAATAYLLRSEGCHVNGSSAAATPLHRASFSGACATMRLLVEDPDCDLLAPDTSFGDKMSPLHKAASGGRYLAVQLLLQTLQARGLLDTAISLLDSNGRTPLKVAIERQRNEDYERQSVARWNAVAGGPPDWRKCIHLLKAWSNRFETGTKSSFISSDARLPAHLMKSASASICSDCADDGGSCRTASWESAFRRALSMSAHASLESTCSSESLNGNIQDACIAYPATPFITSDRQNQHTSTRTSRSESTVVGRRCDGCQEICMALFPKDQFLMCRKCSRRRRQRSPRQCPKLM